METLFIPTTATLLDVETYSPERCAVFCKSADPLGTLQNMTGRMPIRYDGIVYQSSEGAYQAQKFPFTTAVQLEIAAASSGFAAKLVAKKYLVECPDWERHRVWVMYDVLRLKYERHRQRIDQDVQAAQGKPLVELSRKDAFWGAKPTGGYLVGSNVLGKLWEAVLYPDQFPLRIKEIERFKSTEST